MKLLKFYAYVFYRLKRYYDKWQAILIFNAIMISHVYSCVVYYCSVNYLSPKNFWLLSYTNNYFEDRIKIALLFSVPLLLITYSIYLPNKEKFEIYYKEFENENEKIKKKRDVLLKVYYVFSVMFLISAILSPLFFRKW